MKDKKQKVYTTATGQEVPTKFIRKIDRKRDSAALKYYKKALALQEAIAKFKEELIENCDALQQEYMDEYDVKLKENARGGYTLSTIDKAVQIEFTIGSRITFDDRIDMAKAKFFEYIDEVTKGIDPAVRQIVETAFQTTRGKLDPKRIMQLLTLKNDHPTWKDACDLLTQSMSSNTTKRYIQFRQKNEEGKYENLTVDFNAL